MRADANPRATFQARRNAGRFGTVGYGFRDATRPELCLAHFLDHALESARLV